MYQAKFALYGNIDHRCRAVGLVEPSSGFTGISPNIKIEHTSEI
jgi:hypothetical protein